MLHWPDSMMSYFPAEKLLLSSDGFGEHWATSQRFDDEVDKAELLGHAAKYYANILMLFSPLVRKLLAKVAELGLEIDMIAPDHGLIWRSDPGAIIEAYGRWSRQESIRKALIVYDTMWHSTELMACAISDGLKTEGVDYKMFNLKLCHRSDILTEVLDARALILGSPTINNGIMPTMADFLCYLKGLRPDRENRGRVRFLRLERRGGQNHVGSDERDEHHPGGRRQDSVHAGPGPISKSAMRPDGGSPGP